MCLLGSLLLILYSNYLKYFYFVLCSLLSHFILICTKYLLSKPLLVLGWLSVMWSLHLLSFECVGLVTTLDSNAIDSINISYLVRVISKLSWTLSVSTLYNTLTVSCLFHHHFIIGILFIWLDNIYFICIL